MKISRMVPAAAVLSLAGTVAFGSAYVGIISAAVDEQSSEATQQQVASSAVSVADPAVQTEVSTNVAINESVAVAEPAPAEQTAVSPPVVLQDRSHDVFLNADGSLSGRLSSVGSADGNPIPASGLMVRLTRNGRSVATAQTNEEGMFVVPGLQPGVYGLIASGSNGYGVYGFRLRSHADAGGAAAGFDAGVNSVVVPARDFATVKRLIAERFVPVDRSRPIQELWSTEDGVKGVFGQGEPATTIATHQVQLEPGGSVSGEVNLMNPLSGSLYPVSNLMVYFVSNNTIVGSSQVNADGSFVVTGLSSGFYSVVASGDDGVMAMGVEVIDPIAFQLKHGTYSLTSVAASLQLSGAPVDPSNFTTSVTDPGVSEEQPLSVPMGMPFGGGGGGFGGGGAGGGGGGGGLLGTLLGAGVGAGIGAAIADDNNNPPVSP